MGDARGRDRVAPHRGPFVGGAARICNRRILCDIGLGAERLGLLGPAYELPQRNSSMPRQNPRFALAILGAALLWPFPGMPATADAPTAPNIQQVIVTQDLAQCGHAEHILFTVLWQGRVGIASEPSIIGWDKPRVGDRLSGEFMEEGLTEATYLNRTGRTWLSITRTGEALDRQAPLLRQYCEE